MTDQEILEGNKLIAEFMGVKIGVDKYSWRPGCIDPLEERHLAYHEEWGWLMPVVEKIEEIHHVKEGHYLNVRISQGYIQIEGCPGERIFVNTSIAGSKKKAIWYAVVDFIKWYNQQKPS
jgi:hypothetical protein